MAKVALLIGVSEYEPGLNRLPGAVKDVEAMQRVLQHPEMGGFDQVKPLINPDPLLMQGEIESLFSERSKEDLVLLFFSGHGVKDNRGKLYFATRITRKSPKGELMKSTAVPANFIHEIMSHSRSKRQVVLLDCCFSGAFAEGMSAKDDGVVDVKEQLGGEGRAVLTSSTSTQYAFEQQGADLSVYTRYIIEGIETGAADLNNDGSISINELHDYAYKKVQEAAPAMKPKIYAVEEGFKIRLAKVPVGDPKLTYRKEVERCATRGEIFSINRRILNELRDNLGLTPENAAEIEDEVLKPFREYQKKLQRYEEAFAEAVQQEYPISDDIRVRFQRYQDILGLRDEDVAPIHASCVPPKEAPTQSVNTSEPKVATPLPVQPQYPGARVSGFADLRYERLNMQLIETIIHKAWGFSTYFFHTLIKQRRVSPQRESVQPQNPQARISQPQELPLTTDFEQGAGTKQASSSRKNGKRVGVYGYLGSLVTILFTIIVLPSFLNQATKAKQAEAKHYVATMNRAQQAYFAEKGTYSSSLENLGIGLKQETQIYSYVITVSGSGMQAQVISTAIPKEDSWKGYVGGVFSIKTKDGLRSISIICEGNTPSTSRLAPPTLVGGQPQCVSGSTQLIK
ncbi:type IV pilin-like G/H family protein [Microcoleus sp. LAD1_D5]|uniref:caspase, EACC1-associated type n=1 Tax=unclassified Microcoleus TaxID=2642155 RepID=UPI002FCE78A5